MINCSVDLVILVAFCPVYFWINAKTLQYSVCSADNNRSHSECKTASCHWCCWIFVVCLKKAFHHTYTVCVKLVLIALFFRYAEGFYYMHCISNIMNLDRKESRSCPAEGCSKHEARRTPSPSCQPSIIEPSGTRLKTIGTEK